MNDRQPRRLALGIALGIGVALGALTLTSCAGSSDPATAVPVDDWQAVLDEAQGQTVDWFYYGGDDRLNDFVDGEVTDRLADLGVTLNPVRIEDTADAVDKVLGEQRAGRESGGSVDAIWLNGENFATGVQADLWRCGWADDLPNAEYVDLTDPAIETDFGVPVEDARPPGSKPARRWSTTPQS